MKYLLSISLVIFTANSFAYIGDNSIDVDPGKSKEPYCASKITMTVGPNQLHMLGSSNERPNDSRTYDIIEKKMIEVQGQECSPMSKSKANSWDVNTKVSQTCFNSCDSDETKKLFDKNNNEGALGSKTFSEFQNSCRAYCKLSTAFRTKFLQEKTEEAEQMKAHFFQLKKLQEATCADNTGVDDSSRIIQKAKNYNGPSNSRLNTDLDK